MVSFVNDCLDTLDGRWASSRHPSTKTNRTLSIPRRRVGRPPTIRGSSVNPNSYQNQRFAKAQFVVELDADGELLLFVGRASSPENDEYNPMVFRVCPHTLARASRRLKDMLYTHPKTIGAWAVHLQDDKTKPMSTLLRVMHGQFDQVPSAKQQSFADIYELAVVAEKYDVAHLFRPWAAQWVEQLGKRLEDSDVDDMQCLERRAWIAWVLGGKDLYCRSLYGLAVRSVGVPSGEATGSTAQLQPLFQGVCEPPGASASVATLRLEILDAMLKPFRESARAIIKEVKLDVVGGFSCRKHSSTCNDAMLVSAIRCLSQCDLWPLPNPSHVIKSATALEKNLHTLQIMNHQSHRKCRKFLKAWLKNRWPTAGHSLMVTDAQRRHLDTQEKKTGLDLTCINARLQVAT